MATETEAKRRSYPLQSDVFDESRSPKTAAPSSNRHFPHTISAVLDSSNPSHARTLVVCLDGTGDKFDHDNSNVVQLVACLKKHNLSEQVTYYQPGIGTYDSGGLTNGIKAALDMAVGSGLGTHIKDAYRFLMKNYHSGDKICLLGFSRGAYTARCLAGMLHKVGLLPASNLSQVNFAYDFYKDNSSDGWDMSSQFKKTFCTDVTVYFLGIWDCVASVGFIPRTLPFSTSPTNTISYFRHAMSLDEHRAKFKVCQWQANLPLHDDKIKHKRGKTDVLEVWFKGCHADVGGGALPNGTRHMLSRIPLRWMLRQTFACDTGILFDTAALAAHGLDLHTLYPVYVPAERPVCGPPPSLLDAVERRRPGSDMLTARYLLGTGEGGDEHEGIARGLEVMRNADRLEGLVSEASEDYFDARTGINDELVLARWWWVLETWPIKVWVLRGGEWVKKVGCNLGRRRAVKHVEPNVHWTVQDLVDEKKYQVKVRWDKTRTSWQVVA